jgi:hypothetical protein
LVHRIKPKSLRRAAIRSHPKFVLSNAASRGDSSRASRYGHRSARPRRTAPDNHPRPRNSRRSPSVRRRHHRAWYNYCPAGNRWYRSAPLRLHSYRKKNYKSCEDDVADHGSHLKARTADPKTNSCAHLQGCALSTIGFNPIPSLPSNSQVTPSKGVVQSREVFFCSPAAAPTHLLLSPIPYPLFPCTVL